MVSESLFSRSVQNSGKTYENLAKKVDWLKQSTPFRFYWVKEDGTVSVQ